MKVTGAEFMDWFENNWPGEDWYLDENEIETHDDKGEWIIDPMQIYDTRKLGILCWQGPGFERLPMTIASCIAKYRRNRYYTPIAIECPNSKVDMLISFLMENQIGYACNTSRRK